MIPLILVGMGHSKTRNSFIKFAAVAKISAANHRCTSRLCMGRSKSHPHNSASLAIAGASKVSTNLRSSPSAAAQDNW
jgi:hypothetical protein